MVTLNKNGLPLSVITHTAGHHEIILVQLSFDFYRIEARLKKLTGDKAYDRDKWDDEFRHDKHNPVKPVTQDSRKVRQYQRRRLGKRFFA